MEVKSWIPGKSLVNIALTSGLKSFGNAVAAVKLSLYGVLRWEKTYDY